MEDERGAARRSYSAELKALILEQCAAPGASVAKVAMAHGVNANVVHRWRRLGRGGAGDRVPVNVGEFVAVSVPAAMVQSGADIQIELRRGATAMKITWPIAAAADCAAWMRELLR